MPLPKHNFFTRDVLLNSLQVFTVEGRRAREQLIRDDSDTPHIDFFGIPLVLNKLGRHVKRRAQDSLETLRIFFLYFAREAKISNFDVPTVFLRLDKQDVLWFHVTMRYILLVQVVEAHHHLNHNVHGLTLLEAFQFRQSVKK